MFKPIEDVLKPKFDGKKVAIRGWVYRKRSQKKLIFLIIRDSSDIIQAVVKKGSKAWKAAQKITIESSCELKGTIKKDKRAPTGYELKVSDLKIIGLADTYPITRDKSAEFLRDVRHLWIRSRKITQILKVRSEVFKAIHDFYRKKDYTEFQSPIFTTCACEGGSTLFPVKGFGEKVYLSQSWQLYAEAGIQALEKIYTITPAFRAEKSRTIRHLAEYWTAEAEATWMHYKDMLKQEEELILHIVKHVLKTCKKELKELGRDIKELKKIRAPFKKITYKQAIKKLGKKWGHDLTDKEERKLAKEIGKPVFITHFPRKMKAFYMKSDPKDKKVVLAADLLLPGVGETIGGSERIADVKELLKSIKMFGLKKKDYQWYIDLRKYGTVPHSGYGLGIERLVMWLTGAEHIMDTIPFPRTITRVRP
ncbi:asparagine--tRNA ligase [Candidatus Woesearchaeota archaeon]|nr:asparagine--tRNA ligase [Candidatus Woesearchaeota archaeon]